MVTVWNRWCRCGDGTNRYVNSVVCNVSLLGGFKIGYRNLGERLFFLSIDLKKYLHRQINQKSFLFGWNSGFQISGFLDSDIFILKGCSSNDQNLGRKRMFKKQNFFWGSGTVLPGKCHSDFLDNITKITAFKCSLNIFLKMSFQYSWFVSSSILQHEFDFKVCFKYIGSKIFILLKINLH